LILKPAPADAVVPLGWAGLPRASRVATRAFGHRHRHLSGRPLPVRAVHGAADLLMLLAGAVTYPLLLVGYRLAPGHRVYVTGDGRAVAHVATWRTRRRWVVTDVAAWPYGGGAGKDLVRGLQQAAAAEGASLHLKAAHSRLVTQFYGPLGFTPTRRRHWLVWQPAATTPALLGASDAPIS